MTRDGIQLRKEKDGTPTGQAKGTSQQKVHSKPYIKEDVVR